MKQATKRLQDEAKAATRGGTKAIESDCFTARFHFVEDSKEKWIAGPTRRTERRAKADLAKLRQAAQGQATITEGFAAVRQKSRELHQEAEFEAKVAMGIAQYGFVRDAHKVVDSDPESEHEALAGDGAPHGEDGDDWIYDTDFSNPAVVKTLFPAPPPKEPVQPNGAADATAKLKRFAPNTETPAALRVLLEARADPNVLVSEDDPLPLLPEVLNELLVARIDPNQFGRKVPFTPLMCVISRAREEHLKGMVDLLIANGAKYGAEERSRYSLRCDADRIDPIYLQELHRSATVSKPCARSRWECIVYSSVLYLSCVSLHRDDREKPVPANFS